VCFRTFTGQTLSHFTNIHFKPPHMALAAAGGKAVCYFMLSLQFFAAGRMSEITSCLSDSLIRISTKGS